MYKIIWNKDKEKKEKEFTIYEDAANYINKIADQAEEVITLEFTPSGGGWSEEAYNKACKWRKKQ